MVLDSILSGATAVILPPSLISNPLTVEELNIGNNSYNDSSVTEFKLSGLPALKSIVIGDECFGSVRVFELNGLSELESVVIGKKSITIAMSRKSAEDNKRTDGICRIVNCPRLKSIQFSDTAFCDYHSIDLVNLPSLQSIEMGGNCFVAAPSLSLIGLID